MTLTPIRRHDRGTSMDDREAMLRRIALSDPRLLRVPADPTTGRTGGDLDPRWQALVRLGALLATEPSGAALQQVVEEALTLNITRDEIVAALVCLLPTVGLRQAAT